ncbi:hypothetical protein ACI2JA_19695 [Alkalihalobacillus sp. NPDC078783]|uniref:hypothetical protein n=1 Tax=Streptomyces albidoflavus TaxID=1886 RepID=UPI0033DF8226
MTKNKHEYIELENLTFEQTYNDYVPAEHFDKDFAKCKDNLMSMTTKVYDKYKELEHEYFEPSGLMLTDAYECQFEEMVVKDEIKELIDDPNGYFVLYQSTARFALENGRKNKRQALCENKPYYKRLQGYATRLLFNQTVFNMVDPKEYKLLSKTKGKNNLVRECFFHDEESGKRFEKTISPSNHYFQIDEWTRRYNFDKRKSAEAYNEKIKEYMVDVERKNHSFIHTDHLNLNIEYNFDRSDRIAKVGNKKTYKDVDVILEAIKDVKANHLSYKDYLKKNKGSEEYFKEHELTLLSEDLYNLALNNQINSLESEKYKVYEDLAKQIPANGISPKPVEYMHLVGYNFSDFQDVQMMFQAKRVNYKIYHEGDEDREHYYETTYHWLAIQARKYAAVEDKIIIEQELEKFLYYLQRTTFTKVEQEIIRVLLEDESYDEDPYYLAVEKYQELVPEEGEKDKRFIERMVERISKKVAHQYDEENCDTLIVKCKKCDRSMRNHTRNIPDSVKVRKDGCVSTCRECEAERKNKKMKISIDNKAKSLI